MVLRSQALNPAKMSPPGLRRYVGRPRLRMLLRDGLRRKLTTLCGSAGFGKSTLLYDFLQESGVRSAWYRLDDTDRDVAQFASYLAGTVEQHYAGWGKRTRRAALRLDGSPTSRSHLAEVLAGEFNLLPTEPLVVALDGFEAVNSSSEVGELLSYLLEYSPPQLHFYVTSRSVPSLPLAGLRARDDLLEVGESALAFTESEIDALIQQFEGVRLEQADRRFLLERTEGWAAGLVMALQWLRRSRPKVFVDSLREFSGGTEETYSYLAEEVFRSLDEDTQQFLLKTSVFDELYADACDALLDTTDARSRLASLETNGLFTAALGDGRNHFRYHQLFRDFLLAKLQQSCEARDVAGLHRRAGRAMEARGLSLEAIRHYLAAGLPEAAANVLEGAGEELLRNGFTGAMARSMELLPPDLLSSHPWLLVLRARLLRRSYRLEDAREALDRASSLFAKAGDRQGLAWVACELAAVLYRKRLHRQAVTRLEEALALDPGLGLREEIQVRLATNYGPAGNIAGSAQVGEAVSERLQALPRTPGVAAAEITVRNALSRTYVSLGRWSDAADALEEASQLCQSHEISDRLLGKTLAYAGEALTAMGIAGAGLEKLNQAAQLVGGDPYWLERLNLARAGALIDLGMYEEAEDALDSAGSESKTGLAFLRLRQGRTGEALRTAKLAWSRFESSESALERESARVVLGLAFLAAGSPNAARPHLLEAASFFADRGYAHCLASVWWHLARVEYDDEQPHLGVSYLKRAVELMSEKGFGHLQWWLPGPSAWLCVQALRESIDRELVARLAAEQLNGDECLPLLTLLDPSCPELHPLVVGIVQRSAGAETPLAQLASGLLYSCRDGLSRARLCAHLARRRLLPPGVLRLRHEFGLTWKEIEIVVGYWLEPLWEGVGSQPQSRKRCAERLNLAENTLKVHVVNLRRKLDLPAGTTVIPIYALMQELGVVPSSQPSPMANALLLDGIHGTSDGRRR